MKKRRPMIVVLLICMLLVTVLPQPVSANSAAPPNLTIIVVGAPEDMTLTLEGLAEDQGISDVEIKSSLWESCYRIYLRSWPAEVEGSTLVVRSGGEEYRFAVPEGAGSGYEDLLMLDFAAGTLTLGQPAWRKPLLVSLRVALTLVLEGLVFFIMGYRKTVSWVLFVIINLLTQTWLNAGIVNDVFRGGYWFLLFLLMETAIVIVESIVFALAVREKGKLMAVFHAITANLLSLALGGWMLGSLPV